MYGHDERHDMRPSLQCIINDLSTSTFLTVWLSKLIAVLMYGIGMIKRRFRADSKIRSKGAYPLCGDLCRQGLNQIKLASDRYCNVTTVRHIVKSGFHYPSWRPELTGDRFPLPVNTGRADGRAVDGLCKPVTRQLGPLTRAVNSGSGNQALHARKDANGRIVSLPTRPEEKKSQSRIFFTTQIQMRARQRNDSTSLL